MKEPTRAENAAVDRLIEAEGIAFDIAEGIAARKRRGDKLHPLIDDLGRAAMKVLVQIVRQRMALEAEWEIAV